MVRCRAARTALARHQRSIRDSCVRDYASADTGGASAAKISAISCALPYPGGPGGSANRRRYSAWVPLGYNTRAVRLQSIARQVIAEYDGRIPDTIDELLQLKGIGRYTAGAIACFAYHKQVATVDTNIRRVLHRIFLGLEHPAPKLNDAQMLALAEEVLPEKEAYNW